MVTVKLFVFKAKLNASISGGVGRVRQWAGDWESSQLKFTPVSTSDWSVKGPAG